MPTRTDVTVVNQAYDTSGNGGRRLVRLVNGTLVAVVFDSGNYKHIIYKSTDNGATWSQVCWVTTNSTTTFPSSASLVSKGNTVYLLWTKWTASSDFRLLLNKIDILTQTNVDISASAMVVDSAQIDIGTVSLTINSAGTELHAAWVSKNSTYPKSFNIRYAKGTINADGSVTWGVVVQVTSTNTTNYDTKNPCIIVRNDGYPVIIAEQTTNSITSTKISFWRWNGSSFINGGSGYIYDGGSYTQSSPSAYVDKNGRIWVAWHGRDATDTLQDNIRVSYSDDGGITWSSMTKLTSGNISSDANQFPTITANKNNEVFVLWREYVSGYSKEYITQRKWSNNSWGTVTRITDGVNQAQYPSALYDNTFSLNFSQPLFIYKSTSKVGFYGTWIITTISVPQGHIGQKTSADKSNILTYSITTDGTMGTITEKINGTTIATRTNPTSGQNFTVSLSQAQWDAIKYGNAHTLTIEMNGEVWTYTFDKRLNANDDILSAVKGVQDLQTHLNTIKAQLAAAIRAKGGTVNDTDAWSAFVSAVANMRNRKFATGTATASSTLTAFTLVNGASTNCYPVTVTGLTFEPKVIILFSWDGTYSLTAIYQNASGDLYPKVVKVSVFTISSYSYSGVSIKADVSPAYVNSTGFCLPTLNTGGRTFTWIAYE